MELGCAAASEVLNGPGFQRFARSRGFGIDEQLGVRSKSSSSHFISFMLVIAHLSHACVYLPLSRYSFVAYPEVPDLTVIEAISFIIKVARNEAEKSSAPCQGREHRFTRKEPRGQLPHFPEASGPNSPMAL